jgi:hypothetical protein
MAQYETTGGGISYTPDGKKLTKQAYVLTEGTTSVTPANVTGATITSADFVQGEAGTTRVTVTWTEGQDTGGSGGSAGGGTTTELIGGAREIPTEAHPTFKDSVTDNQLKEIKKAIESNQDPDTTIVPTAADNKARILYKLLLRGQEYYLAPAVSYRETTLETQLPTLKELCTVNAPRRTPTVGSTQNWLLTSINARSVARPTGTVAYEVTKEWMLSDRNGWDPEKVIYNGT